MSDSIEDQARKVEAAQRETNQWKALAAMLVHTLGEERRDGTAFEVQVPFADAAEFQSQIDSQDFSLTIDEQPDGALLYRLLRNYALPTEIDG